MNEWISIKDRLPRSEERVLVISDQNYVRVGCLYNRQWCCPIKSQVMKYFNGEKIKITHWMPIPELPKESSNE